MEPSEDFRIAQHNSLQELAHHYDSINWNMHTIFVVLHMGIAGWLVISIGTQWNDGLPGAIIVWIASSVGWCLAKSWKWMFDRHRLYISAAYQRLRTIEESLTGYGDLANFKVHTLMRPVLEASRANRKAGYVATHDVIFVIQRFLMVVYFAIGLVFLIRALLFCFHPAFFDQLRSCLSAMVS